MKSPVGVGSIPEIKEHAGLVEFGETEGNPVSDVDEVVVVVEFEVVEGKHDAPVLVSVMVSVIVLVLVLV